MLKILIAILFIIMLLSLLAGVGFLLKDGSESKRLLTSLKLRIFCAVGLMGARVYGFTSGALG